MLRELTDNECDAIIDDARENSGSGFVRIAHAYVRAGYAAGYRAAQAARPPREPTPRMFIAGTKALAVAEGSFARVVWEAMHDAWTQEQTSGPGEQSSPQAYTEPGDAGPLDHQSAATPLTSVEHTSTGAAQAATDGSAADPVTHLVTALRKAGKEYELSFVFLPAADALERLAREKEALRLDNMNLRDNAERAEAECDEWGTTAAKLLERAERAEAERDALREVVRAADAIWKTMTQTPDRTDAMAAYFTARAKVGE